MTISDVIFRIKKYHYGYVSGPNGPVRIMDRTSRDQILYGNPDQECTGIVTTCWANIDVIRNAGALGANLIICHEALFWNHGDHTEWLKEEKNQTFQKKTELLDQYGIVVWRDHDYIHSGIPLPDGSYVDGIFYGLAKTLGWENNIDYSTARKIDSAEGWKTLALEDKINPISYILPTTTVRELAELLIHKLHLNGVRVIGNPDMKLSRVSVPFHIFGDANYAITLANQGEVDCFLTMEAVDYTLSEYVRDSSMTDHELAIINMGHFNVEEPGIRYMITYLPEAIGEPIPCHFVQSGDNYDYILRTKQ